MEKNRQSLKDLIFVFVFVSIISVCTICSFAVSKTERVSNIFPKHSITVYMGETVKIGSDLFHDEEDCIFCYDDDFYISKVVSSDTSVAKVSKSYDGITIKGLKAGTTIVTAYDDYYDDYYDDVDDEFYEITAYDEIKVTVKPIPSSKVKVSTIDNKNYTGNAIKPSVSLTYGSTKLKLDTDYTVSYKNNKNVGIATVNITLKGKYTGTISKTFKILPVLNKKSANVYLKSTLTLSAKSSATVTWKSSDTAIAKVSKSGVVTPVKAGSVKITATSNGISSVCNVTVKKQALNNSTKTIYVGATYLLKYNGGTGTVTWKSSDTKIVTVSSKGNIKGVKAGTAKVTATRNGVKLTCTITVKNQKINKSSASIMVGDKLTLELVGSVTTVTWKTSDKAIATVSSSGVVSAKKAGKATITATHNGKSYQCIVTVKKASYGTVSGNVTYLYNYYQGNKADTNAMVILVSTSQSAKSMPNLKSYVYWMLPEEINKYNSYGVYATTVDGTGHYKFNNVKVGTYKLIIISSKTTSGAAFDNKTKYEADCAAVVNGLVNDTNAKYLGEYVGYQKYNSTTITVKSNQDYYYGHDFGITYI